MPTTLTSPIVKSQITTATVDGWSLTIARHPNGTLDLTRSRFAATLNLRDADGTVIETRQLERMATNIPPALGTRIRNLQLELVDTLRTAGLLPAGTDTDDL